MSCFQHINKSENACGESSQQLQIKIEIHDIFLDIDKVQFKLRRCVDLIFDSDVHKKHCVSNSFSQFLHCLSRFFTVFNFFLSHSFSLFITIFHHFQYLSPISLFSTVFTVFTVFTIFTIFNFFQSF